MSRRLWAAALATVLSLSYAVPATAHQGNPDYRSELDGIKPQVPGLDVQVLNYDDSLQLENRTGETVIVDGYQHEPYVRITADGAVSVNTRSPAYYINDDRYGETKAPASADPEAAPEWQEVDGTGQYVWHDHRIHYMSAGTPAQVTDESKRTKIFDYRVPIEVGGERAAITGTLYWVGESGGFPIVPFIALAAVALLAGSAIVLRRLRSGDAGERDRGDGARGADRLGAPSEPDRAGSAAGPDRRGGDEEAW
ncbi:MAG: hypothetical protein GEU88_16960 [Solirubrobacterales bacterium]|nr:hypothetical protein [Solirubrobacterales bacterium]